MTSGGTIRKSCIMDRITRRDGAGDWLFASSLPGIAVRRSASRTALPLLHSEQFDIEDQRGVGRNDAAGAAGAIAECGRNNQRPLAADFHVGDAFVPAGNDLMLADRK